MNDTFVFMEGSGFDLYLYEPAIDSGAWADTSPSAGQGQATSTWRVVGFAASDGKLYALKTQSSDGIARPLTFVRCRRLLSM